MKTPFSILVVVGEGYHRRNLPSVLEREGYPFILCSGSDDIVSRIREEPAIRLLMIEPDLGGIDGVEIVRRVRRLEGKGRFPVIFLTPHTPEMPKYMSEFRETPTLCLTARYAIGEVAAFVNRMRAYVDAESGTAMEKGDKP